MAPGTTRDAAGLGQARAVGQVAAAQDAPAVGPRTHRLAAVDGLRALAALWVVLFHIHAFSGVRFDTLPALDAVLRAGFAGVSLFLVLSGFCLYLPFAGGRLARFQPRAFLWRRCQRLLPAYYVSLVLVLVLLVGAGEELGLPPLGHLDGIWQALTHLTLTHTLFENSFYALNGAYWSLGLEWQLYLALPLLIVSIRRFGLWKTVAVVIICTLAYRLGLKLVVSRGLIASDSLLANDVLPNFLLGRWAEFAYGMLAAELYLSGRLTGVPRRWLAAMAGLFALFLGFCVFVPQWPLRHTLFGVAFFLLLILVLRADTPIARVLAWGPLVALGTMSYSLYLVHQPLVQGAAHVLQNQQGRSALESFWLQLQLLPVLLLVAWLLFVTVERRSLSGAQAKALSVPWRSLLRALPGRPSTTNRPAARPGASMSAPLDRG